MTISQFLEQLRESRLLTAEQLREVSRFAGTGSATGLADALVADGALTPYQARRLLSGVGGRLVLGQYRLLDVLGHGGMGVVYKAHHTVMGRTVALKVLSPALQEHAVAQGWFEREVRTLTRLQHPNIVLAYDANEVDGARFLVMEYVEGRNLHTVVFEQGPLAVPLACAMMAEAAEALQYAHEQGLVHRDIKPANLLIPAAARLQLPAADEDEERRPRVPLVKIVDFGLARLRGPTLTETIALTCPEHFVGTPDYASPEQCRDVHAVDVRSDLYSLGCTFYFALTGRTPFTGQTLKEQLAHHGTTPPPPVTTVRPDVPAGVEAILLRLMAKQPAERFQTPAALAKALRPWYATPLAQLWSGATPLCAVPDALAALHADAPGTALVTPVAPGNPAVRAAADPPPAGQKYDQPEAQAREKKDEEIPPSPPLLVLPAGPPGANDRALREAWGRWSRLVAAVAGGRGRAGWDEPGYRRLHERLVAACRAGAADGPAERRGLFRRLGDRVKPWVSLESLERTEPDLLKSLLDQCRPLETALGVRPPPSPVHLFRTGAALLLIVWLLFQGGAALWRLLGTGSGFGRWDLPSLVHSLQLDSLPGQAYLLLPIIALAAVLVVRR